MRIYTWSFLQPSKLIGVGIKKFKDWKKNKIVLKPLMFIFEKIGHILY
jgi:hypothetical protein